MTGPTPADDPRATASPPAEPSAADARPAAAPLDEQLARLGSAEIVVCLLTYDNAATVPAVVTAVRAGLAQHFGGVPAALINADAGSSDGTPERVAAGGLPTLLARHEAPAAERVAVPFHGVPGRGAALRLALSTARRLGARVVLVLEADVTTVTDEWIARLARPVWEDKADLVLPAYTRHRWDGTITNLLLAPLVRALYGRRLRQPLPGTQAMSGRLVEHLMAYPTWGRGRDAIDLWIVGTAVADGFSVREAWLGRRRVESRTRSADLPSMVAQALGEVFTVMAHHQDLWLEVRGSEPVPTLGAPAPPDTSPMAVDVERMIAGFRQGLRDLGRIWEHILAPETMGEVLALDASGTAGLRFPDDLWARVVYDFALGYHYGVVHREHLLRSLVPLYLGRTAAFVLATAGRDAAATEAALESVGLAFEQQKPYLVARWRS
jgi:hypothetical protein